MQVCTTDNLKDYILDAYLIACETQNPGLVERTIEAVSAEIIEMLAARYPQPWASVPSTLVYIASTIAAYRTACAITTLVTSEASTGNEWLPLQKEWQRATKLLGDIATGKTTLGSLEAGTTITANTLIVSTQSPLFDLRGL